MYLKTYTKSFKKSLRNLEKSGNLDLKLISKLINLIAEGKKLDIKYRDHKLSGEYEGCRECHIKPDLLLIYQIREKELILVLIDIGSHSELF